MGRLKQACAVLGGGGPGEPCAVCDGTDVCPFEQEVPDDIDDFLPMEEQPWPTKANAHLHDDDEVPR